MGLPQSLRTGVSKARDGQKRAWPRITISSLSRKVGVKTLSCENDYSRVVGWLSHLPNAIRQQESNAIESDGMVRKVKGGSRTALGVCSALRAFVYLRSAILTTM